MDKPTPDTSEKPKFDFQGYKPEYLYQVLDEALTTGNIERIEQIRDYAFERLTSTWSGSDLSQRYNGLYQSAECILIEVDTTD